jgi:hypothetical protein
MEAVALEGPFLSIEEYKHAEQIRQRLHSRMASLAPHEMHDETTFSLTSTGHESSHVSHKKKKKRDKHKDGRKDRSEDEPDASRSLANSKTKNNLEEGATQTYDDGWSLVLTQENTPHVKVKKVRAERRKWNPPTPQGEEADYVLRRYNFAVDKSDIVRQFVPGPIHRCHLLCDSFSNAVLKEEITDYTCMTMTLQLGPVLESTKPGRLNNTGSSVVSWTSNATALSTSVTLPEVCLPYTHASRNHMVTEGWNQHTRADTHSRAGQQPQAC